jgi:hypothetical protein
MNNIEIEFEIKGSTYKAVILVRQKMEGREFLVTVLNPQLERLLYGNSIIKEVDGILQATLLPGQEEQAELKLIIAARLSSYLEIPCFVGDECLYTAHTDESCVNG